MTLSIQPHNVKASTTWDSPGIRYDEISRTIADSISHCVMRLKPQAGERILDLACGTGWSSREVKRAAPEASVIGVDLGSDLVNATTELARSAGLDIEYRVGDAEKLPFEDASFDAVISTCGVMFASHPQDAAAELGRIVRPGGRIALTTWRPDSTLFEMFQVMKPYMPPPPATPPPSPFLWGREERVRELLGGQFDLRFEEAVSYYRGETAEAAYEMWSTHYGPMKTLAGNLEGERAEQFRRDMVAFFARFKTDLGIQKPRTYLLSVGVRR